jgi:hypothetical protein
VTRSPDLVKKSQEEQRDMQSRIDDKFNLIDHPDSGVENTVADFPARTPPRANELVAGDKEVHANYFLLKLNTETPLFEYAIEDIPVGINQILHRKMFEGAIAAILPPNAHTGKYATDHLKTIIAWEELQMNPAAKHIVHESGSRRWDPWSVPAGKAHGGNIPSRSIYIRLVRRIDLQNLRSFSEGQGPPRLWDSTPEVKALNIILSSCYKSHNMIQVGPDRFFHKTKGRARLQPYTEDGNTSEGYSLYTLRGYSYTVKPAIGGVMLNLNTTTSAFFDAQTVARFLGDPHTMTDEKKRHEALLGARVLITYGRGQTPADQGADMNYAGARTKTIQAVSSYSIANQTFIPSTNAAPQSVANYLQTSKCSPPRRSETNDISVRSQSQPSRATPPRYQSRNSGKAIMVFANPPHAIAISALPEAASRKSHGCDAIGSKQGTAQQSDLD